MIKVTPRSRYREDRAGDPLDGLVNLFDLGIVLSVAFLLAALSSLNLTKAITKNGLLQTRQHPRHRADHDARDRAHHGTDDAVGSGHHADRPAHRRHPHVALTTSRRRGLP
jgi:hypothetical protein